MIEAAPTPTALRLSELTADSTGILQVIAYFDAFTESAANADTIIRATALLTECPVGASWADGTVIRYNAAGRLLPTAAGTLGDPRATDPAVWLERRGPRGVHPLDQFVMDRLRHCLRVVSARQAANPLRMDDPALLEVVLSEKERREDRVRAMRLLGLDPARATRVLAVAGPAAAEAVRIIGEQMPVLRQTVIGSTVAVLVQDPALSGWAAEPGRPTADSGDAAEDSWRARGLPTGSSRRAGPSPDAARHDGGAHGQGWDKRQGQAVGRDRGKGHGHAQHGASEVATSNGPEPLPIADRGLSDALNRAVVRAFPASRAGAGGPWIGMGERLPAVAAATSWEQARRALRFASSTWHGRRVVAFERLGSLELLADMPVQRLLGNADVLRINEFARTEAGALAVDTLEAFCMFGTLRGTAHELHLHHSTVAARIAQVEAVMGWDMGEALDRFMATLVLTVRRIALSSAELAAARAPGER